MENSIQTRQITLPVKGGEYLEGELMLPSSARALVLFSHGSGSSRFSPRNNFLASLLHEKRIATFLFDLLTTNEDTVYENRFNIGLLTERLVLATEKMINLPITSGMEIGYFGASTGAASALSAAVLLKDYVKALVLRGGRPDFVPEILPKVKAPTLLIVGELDKDVLELNRYACNLMQCEKKLETVKGATHLFEENDTLLQVGKLASEWYLRHFTHR
jgi:pimeloyl-ACP methyl ester carboxylesterase